MPRPHQPNTVNGNVVRVVALATAALATVSLHSDWAWLSALLAVDFVIRGWTPIQSPLQRAATLAVRLGGFGFKPAYAPPKRFAAQVGSVIALSAALLHLGPHTGATVVTLALIVAASLEAFAGFCVACWLYPYVHRGHTQV